jgi:hypothetical protein
MDERRDRPPRQEVREPIVAAATRLSPLQEAWARFVKHVTVTCADCHDIDRARCERAEELWRAYRAAGDGAYRQLNGESVLPAGQ